MASDDNPRRPPESLYVLVVDDEEDLLDALAEALAEEGHEVKTATDGSGAMGAVAEEQFDLIISDIRMPRVDGLALFEEIRRVAPATEVILITGKGSIDEAVSALKRQAADYLAKPFSTAQLLEAVDAIADRVATRRLFDEARNRLKDRTSRSIVGDSSPMRQLKEKIEAIAPSTSSVVITGESGTGKELVARAIHDLSPRGDRPFVVVNCAAFPENLLESELFGYERGAFTGANRRRAGRFHVADGGTLFLDEIADAPLMAQAKLLRVLQEGTFEPLGTNQTVRVDVRVLSACNTDLRARVQEGTFREDLFYRLKVFELDVPPLRERLEDLPLLVAHFLDEHTSKGARPRQLSREAWAALARHDFPGNVRELEHAIEHAVVLAKQGSEITLDHLPADLVKAHQDESPVRPLTVAVDEFERRYLIDALARTGGHKTEAASLLDVSRKTLWLKLKRHNID